jgi:uncharacterized protein YbjT (DUF2867 family)
MGQAAGSPTKPQSCRTTNRGTVRSVILVIRATGNIGRHVVSLLLRAGAAVRAVTRNIGSTGLPNDFDVVRGDLSDPGMLDACLEGVEAAPAVFLDAVTRHARRVVYLLYERVGDGPERQTGKIITRIAAELAG